MIHIALLAALAAAYVPPPEPGYTHTHWGYIPE